MKQELTEDQQFCADVLAAFARGKHHLPKVSAWGDGVAVNWGASLATYDFDHLTRLVLLAHANAVRIEIRPCAPKLVRICAFRRKPEAEGLSMWERHPDLTGLMCKATERDWTVAPNRIVKPEEVYSK